MRAQEFLPEIQFNQVTHKSDVSRYDFDDYIGGTEPTGKVIGGYEIHEPVNYPYKAFLIKSNDDEGFLGALQLTKLNGMWKSEVMFAPEIQGKGFAIPLYRYAIIDQGLTIVSDRSQSPGGAAIWEKLAQQPDINVYIYDTGDKKLHGEYDPRDSGRVYGPEDWRHKIRLVATTDTATGIDEAWSKKYKDSINCSNPKGFSQKAHCAGRKKKTNEGLSWQDEEQLEDWGNRILDQKDIGNYSLFAIQSPGVSSIGTPDVIQLAINKNNESFTDYYNQDVKHTEPGEKFPLGAMQDFQQTIEGWINKYGKLMVLSSNAAKNSTYKRLLSRMGFVVQPFQYGPVTALYISNRPETRSVNELDENFHDGKKKGKSRPGRVKRAGASCKGSVTDLRAKAKKYSGERGKMYHWCANMKAGKKK